MGTPEAQPCKGLGFQAEGFGFRVLKTRLRRPPLSVLKIADGFSGVE